MKKQGNPGAIQQFADQITDKNQLSTEMLRKLRGGDGGNPPPPPPPPPFVIVEEVVPNRG